MPADNKLVKQKSNKPSSKSIPPMIGLRVGELEPLIALWMEKNPGVSTSNLLRRGLMTQLAPIAGKRYAHLLES